jgi:hypothetical protein
MQFFASSIIPASVLTNYLRRLISYWRLIHAVTALADRKSQEPEDGEDVDS